MTNNDAAVFSNLVELAGEKFGGTALYANDEFFAEKENLIKPGRGVFIPDKYTEFGKWMDGWESRRKRVPGHDFCIIKLGIPGIIRAVDVDTNHFLGNNPQFASLDAVHAKADASVDELLKADWKEILSQQSLKPGSQNLAICHSSEVATHIRLNIFPDGGVARLRVFGEVASNMPAGTLIDLAGIQNGGVALACSDMFFSSKDNLIMPHTALDMGDGWETKRRRGAGHDWIIVKLGAAGKIEKIEIDTNHFKGNYPDTCMLECLNVPDAKTTELTAQAAPWQPLLERTKLSASNNHVYTKEILVKDAISHVRLNIYPDGGISRLRVWGKI